MSKLWRIEFRRQAWPFLSAMAILGLLSALRLVTRNDAVDLVSQLAGMIVWSGLAGYAGLSLYNFYYRGHDLLMHLSPAGRAGAGYRRAVVSGAYLYGLFILLLLLNLDRLHEASLPGGIRAVIAYYVLARVVSIAAFVGLLLGSVAAAKLIGNKILAAAVTLLSYSALTIINGFVVYGLFFQRVGSWALGISGSITAVNTYLNIVPVTFEARSDKLPISTIWVNLVVLTAGVLAWAVISRRGRFNFIKR